MHLGLRGGARDHLRRIRRVLFAECSWPEDLDCEMPMCGDGIVNGDETCDGDCPTAADCDALTTDACNPYSLQGLDFVLGSMRSK